VIDIFDPLPQRFTRCGVIPCPLVSAGTDFPDAARFSAETTACPAATRCRTSRSSPSCRGAAGQSDYSLGPPYSTLHIKRHAILHRNQAGRKGMSRPVSSSPPPSGSAPPSALSCPDGSDALAHRIAYLWHAHGPPDALRPSARPRRRSLLPVVAAAVRHQAPVSVCRVELSHGGRGEWLRCGPTCDRMTGPA
jgi:hypothetical protein